MTIKENIAKILTNIQFDIHEKALTRDLLTMCNSINNFLILRIDVVCNTLCFKYK